METLTQQQNHQHHHFLLVTITAQGQINPARHLARRLTRTTSTARVTIATPISSHHLLFPSSSNDADQETIVDEGLISYAPYSDGFDQGFHPDVGDVTHFMTQLNLIGSQTLTLLARSLADRGRPVTCVIYTLLTDWASDVATNILNVPSILYWIQPATVFSIFYHYFHGYADIINSHRNNPSFTLNLPGLPPLQIKDLPSMLTANPSDPLLDSYANIMKVLERYVKPRVLMNTFHSLEAGTIDNIHDVDLMPVGPMIDEFTMSVTRDLFERDTSEYMEWLDTKEPKSVIYISFGSLSRFSTLQMEEMSRGLRASGPYLWVVRRDVREKDSELVEKLSEEARRSDEKGMVIEWCEQVRVLMHESVGCFVTHCGWNSVMESLVCGVPMVMLPQRMEQMTNAKMVEDVWGIGVRVGEVLGEIGRCLEVVMGEGERGVAIRRRVEMWREKAREAVEGVGLRGLLGFLDEIM